MSLLLQVKGLIKRVNNNELMKIQDVVSEEVTRRETAKYNTKGETVERKNS